MNENQNNGVISSQNGEVNTDSSNQNVPNVAQTNVATENNAQFSSQQPIQSVEEQVNTQPPVQPIPNQVMYQQMPQQNQNTVGADGQQNNCVYQPAYAKPKQPKKPMNKNMLIAIIIAAAVVFVSFASIMIAVVLPSLGKTTIDLSKYYTIEVKGFNEFGKPEIVKAEEGPVEYIISKSSKKTDAVMKMMSYYDFFDGLKFEFDKAENLKNGDTVKAVAVFDKAKAKELKLNLKNTTLKLKVKGLGDAIQVDAFADAKIEFEGKSPFGSMSVKNNNPDDFVRTITYKIDGDKKNGKLQNGDVITVKAVYDEDYALEKGYAVVAQTKEYTVEGLDAFVTDKAVVPADVQAKFVSTFKEKIDSIIDENWEFFYKRMGEYTYNVKKGTTDSVELVSSTLMTKKTNQTSSNINRIVLTYKVTLTAEGTGTRTGYISGVYTRAGYKADGSLFTGYSNDFVGNFTVYEKEEDLTKAQIDKYTDTYISSKLFENAAQ